jgi:hypothetical protein
VAAQIAVGVRILEPGPKLDALVAEKVFGWRRIYLRPNKEVEPRIPWMWDKNEGCLISECQQTPAYSTSIAAAWEVWSKLFAAQDQIALTLINGEYKVCEGSYGNFGGMDMSTYPTAKTAPHAICLAALKAVGVEE